MFLTRNVISRRTVLRGLGVSLAVPLLDSMTPAVSAAPMKPVRLVAIEMVHGAAGSSALGRKLNLWAPAATGTNFDLSTSSLSSLSPFRDAMTIVSNTSVANAEAFDVRELGGNHVRASSVFLTQSHPKRAMGADVEAGTSIDQIYARHCASQTPIPSLQLAIEPSNQPSACGFGYSCVYSEAISWASPTQPLPGIRDPRIAFEELFGLIDPGLSPAQRASRGVENRSILDFVLSSTERLKRKVGAADRNRLDDYLSNLREVERRIQGVERFNRALPPSLPTAPTAIPESFSAHVRLMFDLQVLAFQSDITRVFSFKLGRDNSNRVYPESGFRGAFHPSSHHGDNEPALRDFARLNAFHVGQLSYFLSRLNETRDVEGSLLDNTALLYGSPMGDSNLHEHNSVPFFLAGHAGGALRGGRHLATADGTPLANVMVSLLHMLGVPEAASFGDSTGAFDLNAVP